MNDQKGYTVMELMMALFVFGLIIAFIHPLFQTMMANAREQSTLLEVNQQLTTQMEKLIATCSSDQKGTSKQKINGSHLTMRIKWDCKKINESLMQISVEVEWKNQKGELKRRKLETHRFRTRKDLPISS